jgi:hypothetical protein
MRIDQAERKQEERGNACVPVYESNSNQYLRSTDREGAL